MSDSGKVDQGGASQKKDTGYKSKMLDKIKVRETQIVKQLRSERDTSVTRRTRVKD